MNRIKHIFEVSNEAIYFVDNEVKSKIKNVSSSLEDVSVFLFAKSTKTFRALLILCNKGFGEDAAILARKKEKGGRFPNK